MQSQFLFRLLLATVAPVLGLSVSACSNDIVAAELVNAVVNAADFSDDAAQSTFPSPLMCKENPYTISGGSYRITGTASAGRATVAIRINMQFPKTAEIQTEDNLNFFCDLTAAYDYDASKGKLLGAGEITTCDDFRCEYRGAVINCDKMKEALQKYKCQ